MHYGAEEEHGIGIALHYDSGPVNLNFYRCKSVDSTTCSDVVASSKNSGTIEIMMKAPDKIDACDQHVRASYPQMVKLIDPTDLRSGNNFNKAIAYIDIPFSIDGAGKGVYKSMCYDCDQRNPDQSKCTSTSMSMPMAPQQFDIGKTLANLSSSLSRLQVDQGLLRVEEMRMEAEAIGTRFATFPELAEIRELLSQSMEGISQILLQVSLNAKLSAALAKKQIKPEDSQFQILSESLGTEQHLLTYVVFLENTKNGSDCRAPIMRLTAR